MVTYTPEDVASIDALEVYSDSALTILVEALASADVGVGLYESSNPLDLSLYAIGTTYFLKIQYTPVGDVQRTQSFPILPLPQANPSGASPTTDTTCRDSTHLEAPDLFLRIARGGYREEDFENANQANVLNRYEAEFQLPADKTHKQLHFEVSSLRGGAPWAPLAMVFDAEIIGEHQQSGGQS